jgi:hypothetical protein
LDPELILFLLALTAGAVDAIAGGGGLITMPALLWTGLGPVEALATNKAQGVFGTAAATANFIHKDLRRAAFALGESAPPVAGALSDNKQLSAFIKNQQVTLMFEERLSDLRLLYCRIADAGRIFRRFLSATGKILRALGASTTVAQTTHERAIPRTAQQNQACSQSKIRRLRANLNPSVERIVVFL